MLSSYPNPACLPAGTTFEAHVFSRVEFFLDEALAFTHCLVLIDFEALITNFSHSTPLTSYEPI